MRNIILGILVGILLGSFFGYFIFTKFILNPIPSDYVTVTVDNCSGRNIKTLFLRHEKGNIEIKELPNRESVKLIFKKIGENSYQIGVTLDNDSVILSPQEYIESGYRRKAIIYKDHIVTDRNS